MATVLRTFRKVLGSASAEAISSVQKNTPGFAVRCETANAGNIFIGDSTVTPVTGMFLQPGESNEKYARSTNRGSNVTYDLSKIYIIGTSGDAVRVEYEENE